MEAEKREILDYLKAALGQFVSVKEICRRAGGKHRHADDPRWAVPVLRRLVEEGLIERDAAGHYRLKPPETSRRKSRRWVSPQVAKILRASGKSFGDYQIEDLDSPENQP
ncbi:MAG TPA: hypothetical protein VI136_02285 [Verrucomicrobiae bacterium]